MGCQRWVKLSISRSFLFADCSCIYNRFCFYTSLLQSSPNNMGGMNNPPGTPRDDGEMGGNFLNPFQSESVSRANDCHLTTLNSYPWPHDKPVQECKQRVRLILFSPDLRIVVKQLGLEVFSLYKIWIQFVTEPYEPFPSKSFWEK